MIFNNIIPCQIIDSIIFTKYVLDYSIFILFLEDVLEKIDSHKVEQYSSELLAEFCTLPEWTC